jgi:hypothetical protein
LPGLKAGLQLSYAACVQIQLVAVEAEPRLSGTLIFFLPLRQNLWVIGCRSGQGEVRIVRHGVTQGERPERSQLADEPFRQRPDAIFFFGFSLRHRGKWNKRDQAQGAVSRPNGLKLLKLGSARSFGSRNARSRVGAKIGSVCHSVFASKYRTAAATEG